MMIPSQLAIPFPIRPAFSQPVLERAAVGDVTLFAAPPGYLFTNHLADLLQSRGALIIWLRAGPEHRDPASLLLALIAGAERVYPGCGARTLQLLRQKPGGLHGWPPLFTALARDIAEAASSADHHTGGEHAGPLALVIQHLDALSAMPRTLMLLWEHFLPLLPQAIRILTSHHSLPRQARLPLYARLVGPRDLRLDEHGAALLVEEHDGCRLSLPADSLRRMVALAQGREVALEGLLAAGQALGGDALRRAVEESITTSELLARVTRRCLDCAQPRAASLYALALAVPYLNPELIQTVVGAVPNLPAAWMQPLQDRWARLNCVWRDPLRAALRPGEFRESDLLEQAARCLVQQGAFDQAVPLLLDLNLHDEAARVLVQVVEPMIDRGQWETVSTWLARLPEEVRRNWSWLTYAEGELAAARGQTREARKLFAAATRLFNERGDRAGECQGLLTQSALSDRENDPGLAQQYARQAQALAQQNELPWQQGWAGWQLGRLAAAGGNLEAALSNFERAALAASSANDAQMAAFVGMAAALARQRLDLRRSQDEHLHAMQEAERLEQESAGQLDRLLNNPSLQAVGLVGQYGWSLAPMFLKLPQTGETLPISERLAALLLDLLRPRAAPRPEAEEPPARELEAVTGSPIPVTGKPELAISANAGLAGIASAVVAPSFPFGLNMFKATQQAVTPVEEGDSSGAPFLPETPALRGPAIDISLEPAPAARPDYDEPVTGPLSGPGRPVLNAYLLGAFRVILNDAAVENWPGGRAKGLLAFLLTQRGRPIPRDVIMETFWPDAGPDSARNSLNVAIHSLRQALKACLDHPVVLFHENSYQTNPDLTVWLDIDSYERHALTGRKAEENGQLSTAVRQYEMAISLYQGDLLAENLYDDWPVVERERLRVLYMETLDRLSLIYYNQAQYAACASLCQRMLAHDACREDAHCRLMVCYSRQGQNNLALRQYQACVESLRRDLDVFPSPSTKKLYEQIKRRDAV